MQIVRSDNLKLWKHLETAKDKQLIMQEKLKKIMWILFQIYRGKQGIPKLSSNGDSTNVISEEYVAFLCVTLCFVVERRIFWFFFSCEMARSRCIFPCARVF